MSAPGQEREEKDRSLEKRPVPTRPHRGRDFTLLLTNAGKVAGLILGILEATDAHPNRASLIFYGFLILGVQRAEELALNAIDRFVGKE